MRQIRASYKILPVILLAAGMAVGSTVIANPLTIAYSGSLDEGRPIAFEAKGSSGAASFEWDFGDGSPVASGIGIGKTHHTYADEGTYTVTVRSVDSNGIVSSASIKTTVRNVAPRIVDLQAPPDVKIGRTITLFSKVQDPGSGDVLTYRWDFGDGTSTSGVDLRNPKHTFRKRGVFSVTLSISDGDGGSVTRTIIVPVEQFFDIQISGQISGRFDAGNSQPPGFLMISHQSRPEVPPGNCALGITISAPQDYLWLGGNFPAPLRTGTYPIGPRSIPVGFAAQYEPACTRPDLDCTDGKWWLSESTGGNINITRVTPKEISGSFSFSTDKNFNVQGTFVSVPATVYGVPIGIEEGTCIRTEDFHVTDYSWKSPDNPQNSRFRKNTLIDYENPEIHITLSEEVDLDTFFDGFVVEYQRPDGQYVEVPGLLLGIDDHTVSWSPLTDLMDGVIYRASVRHGKDGIRGKEGETMKSPFVWQFETLLNMEEGRNGVTATLYQVVADADLVPGKSTLTRVYVNWVEKKEVHPSAQTKSATIEISIKDSGKKEIYPKKKVQVKRPDLYSKEEKKHGLNSINFFHWEPAGSEASPLEVEVEQLSQAASPPKKFKGYGKFEFDGRARTLNFDYYFLNIGPMHQAVTRALVRSTHALAYNAASYVTQNFPVVDTQIRYRGQVSMDWPDLPELSIGKVRLFGVVPMDEWFMDRFYAEVRESSNADVIVAFAPDIQPVLAGHAYRSTPAASGIGALPRLVGIYLPDGGSVQTVTHEIGHSFGLQHTVSGPCSVPGMTKADLQNCINSGQSDRIEGYRIAPGGKSGWNKSATEGNAEATGTPGSVISLMNSLALPPGLSFILPADYEHLQKVFSSSSGADLGNDPISSQVQIAWIPEILQQTSLPPVVSSGNSVRQFLASRAFAFSDLSSSQSGETATEKSLRVRGMMARDGTAFIEDILPVFRSTDHTARGAFEAVLVDSSGVQLASISFDCRSRNSLNLHPYSGEGASFEVIVPDLVRTRRIEIRSGSGEKLAERTRSPSPPEVQFLSPAAGSLLTARTVLKWEGTDQDNDGLRYDLYYAADGNEWRPILIGSKRTSYTIHSEDLEGGSAPGFKLVASDGFNTGEAALSIAIGGIMPRPLFLQGGQEVEVEPELTVVFQSPIGLPPAGSKPVRIETSEGDEVAVSFRLHEQKTRLRITPSNALKPNTEYRLRFYSGLEDESGKQLEQNLAWTFRTGDPAMKASMPEPPSLLLPELPPEEEAVVSAPPHASAEPARLPGESQYLKVSVGKPLDLNYDLDLSNVAVTGLCERNDLMVLSFQNIAPASSGIINLMLKPEAKISADSTGSFPLDMLNLAYQPDGAQVFTTIMGTGRLTLEINQAAPGGNLTLKGSFSGTVHDSRSGQTTEIHGRFYATTNCTAEAAADRRQDLSVSGKSRG